MRALIHIGIPKSGTSSIQAFLAQNRTALSRQSILYAPFNPEFGSQFEFATTALDACGAVITPDLERRRLGFARPADQSAYVAAYRDWLDRQLATASETRFVASSEHIYAWLTTPAQIEALDAFLTARFSEVRYLVYLRAQDDLILSSYSEAIRRGATHGVTEHLARHSRWSHWSRLKHWHQVIGPKRLIVRLTQADALTGGDLLTDFCAVAGIDARGLSRPARVNASLSTGEIALRRLLNRMLPVLAADGRLHPLYRFALRALRPLMRARPDRPRLTAQDRAAIFARNALSNEKIRKRYFKTRPVLFDPPPDRAAGLAPDVAAGPGGAIRHGAAPDPRSGPITDARRGTDAAPSASVPDGRMRRHALSG